MKKLTTIGILSLILAGCATQSHKTTVVDPATKVSTTTVDKSSQSDNAALSLIGSTVKIGGDIISAVLPPLIPVIVGGLVHPVTTPPSNP